MWNLPHCFRDGRSSFLYGPYNSVYSSGILELFSKSHLGGPESTFFGLDFKTKEAPCRR